MFAFLFFFFYEPYPWPHSTSQNPLTAQQNTRGSVAAVENLPPVVLLLSSIETDQGVLMETHYCYPSRFFIPSDGNDRSECLLLWKIQSPHHLKRGLWTLLSGEQLNCLLTSFHSCSPNHHSNTCTPPSASLLSLKGASQRSAPLSHLDLIESSLSPLYVSVGFQR